MMTTGEKLEQALTRRPNSFVPAHTLERVLGLQEKRDEERLFLNWAMNYGQGALLGAVRALMAERGFRGPVGSFMLLNLRLLNDQTWRTPLASAPPLGRGRSTSRPSTCCTRRSTPSPPGPLWTGSCPALQEFPSRASARRGGNPKRQAGTCDDRSRNAKVFFYLCGYRVPVRSV